MPVLSEEMIQELLVPFMEDADVPNGLYRQLKVYLELLLKWNDRTNLTAIRKPEEIVERHFGESLFLGKHLPRGGTLLDYGSGAGFPGLPIQLVRPEVKVTLAESQGKKANFLREVVRELGCKTEVWPHRVEAMEPERRFDMVTMRAVDKMDEAVVAASSRVTTGGIMALLISGAEGIKVPGSQNRSIRFIR